MEDIVPPDEVRCAIVDDVVVVTVVFHVCAMVGWESF